MEYEFAKHTQLVLEQRKLRAAYEVLEKMPVGMAAFQEDYDKYVASMGDTVDAQ